MTAGQKLLVFLLLLVFCLLGGSAVFASERAGDQFTAQSLVGGTTWYVDDDGRDYPNAQFAKIQDALEAASDGDKILVYPGTYRENLEINKRITLVSASGAGSTVIEAADASRHVISVAGGGVIIKGFTVTGATGDRQCGIFLGENARGCLVMDNVTTGNFAGIGLYKSYRNIVTRNISQNNKYGIGLSEGASGGCAAEQAVAQAYSKSNGEASGYGAILSAYRNLRDFGLKQEYIDAYYRYSPLGVKIFLTRPDLALQACRLMGKYAPAVHYSVYDGSGHDLVVTAEDVQEVVSFIDEIKGEIRKLYGNNSAEGSEALALLNQFIEQFNLFSGCSFAEAMHRSVYFDARKIKELPPGEPQKRENKVEDERSSQMVIPPGSNDNYIYMNNFYRSSDGTVYSDKWSVVWHSPNPILYEYQGTEHVNYLGNYYEDYGGSDADSDGIGDEPYPIKGTANSYDEYPLAATYDRYHLGRVGLRASTRNGRAPLDVTFIADSPVVAEEYQWDVDNDGKIDYFTRENTVLHRYEKPGFYSAVVIVKSYGDAYFYSDALPVTVSDPGYVKGEIYFEPYFPKEKDVSEVMKGGKAFRYYRLLDRNKNPLPGVVFNYRYAGSDNCFRAVTDEAGYVAVETDWVYGDRHFDLQVLNEDGSTVKTDVHGAPSFDVRVKDRTFSQEWSLLLGRRLSAGAGGPSAKLGPLEFETIKAGLEGSLVSNLILKYNLAGSRNDVTLGNEVSAGLTSSLKGGIFGSLWKDRGGPEVEIGTNVESQISCTSGVEGKFDDFMSESGPAHDEQVLSAAALFLESIQQTAQAPLPLMDRLWNIILDKLNLNSYNTLSTQVAMGLQAGAGAGVNLEFKNPLAPDLGINLVGGDIGYNFAYKTTAPASEDAQNKTRTSECRVVGETDLSLFKVNLEKEFNTEIGRVKPPCTLDIFGLDKSYEATQSIQLERNNNVAEKLTISRALPAETDWDLKPSGDSLERSPAFIGFIPISNGGSTGDSIEKSFTVEIKGPDAIKQVAAHSEVVKNILDENILAIDLTSFDDAFAAAYRVSSDQDWSLKKTSSRMVSEKFDIELGEGVFLGLGFDVEGKYSFAFDEERGRFSSSLGMLTLEKYAEDPEVKNNSRSLGDFLKVFGDALAKPLKEAKKFVDTAFNKINEGVAQAGATLKGLWNNAVGSITWVKPVLKSYSIYALPGESAGKPVRTSNQAYKAVTVGDVYIVNLTDENKNPITDFSNNPLTLTISYDDAMLADAGLGPDAAQHLSIYFWDGSSGYYIYQPSEVDEVNQQVTASIKKPGQYLLAVDMSVPVISSFEVSDHTPTPTISARITDDLSGIDPSGFIFKLDGSPVVTEVNLFDYYNPSTGWFKYRVQTPLADGTHSAELLVRDTAGNLSDTAQITFEVRSAAPVIVHEPVQTAAPRTDVFIQAVITDDNQVKEACLFYKPEGSPAGYKALAMSQAYGAEDRYCAVIPENELVGNLKYYIMARDVDGNEASIDPVVIRVSDAGAPVVVQTSPANGAVVETVTMPIEVRFSEEVQPGTAFDSVTCTEGGKSVAVYCRLTGRSLIITPVDSLSYGASYSINIPAAAVQDMAGNNMPADYAFSFRTVAEESLNEPVVMPARFNVPPGKIWTIRFNVKIDPETVTRENITVTAGGVAENISLQVGEDGRTVLVLPPPEGYTPGKTYCLQISRNIRSTHYKYLKRPVMMEFTVAGNGAGN